MIPEDRRENIISLIRERGAVKVSDLSEFFGVSDLTVRRDLDLLESKGLLERSHGGAVLRKTMASEPSYREKEKYYISEKSAIARAAVNLIEDGDTVFVNSGSTNHLVLRLLAPRKVRVITSHAGGLSEIDDMKMELIVVGGIYRPQSHSLVGVFANESIRRVFAQKAIIGVDGVSLKSGLTTPNEQEAEVTRQMLNQTLGKVIVVADHTKIGVVSNFLSVPAERADILVTDKQGEALIDKDRLEELGLRLILADNSDNLLTGGSSNGI